MLVMDQACKLGHIPYMAEIVEASFCPVPVHIEDYPVFKKITTGLPVRIVCLSRLGTFKTLAIEQTIHEVAEWARARKRRVELNVIGDGPDELLLRHVASIQSTNSDGYFHSVFHGRMNNTVARKWIRDFADISIGMGTASLDAAAEGVPSIVQLVADTTKPSGSGNFFWPLNSSNKLCNPLIQRMWNFVS